MPLPFFNPAVPKLHNIYMDKICANRYADTYELVGINAPGNTYSLRKVSTNQISLVTLVELNTFYYIRTNYVGHV